MSMPGLKEIKTCQGLDKNSDLKVGADLMGLVQMYAGGVKSTKLKYFLLASCIPCTESPIRTVQKHLVVGIEE